MKRLPLILLVLLGLLALADYLLAARQQHQRLSAGVLRPLAAAPTAPPRRLQLQLGQESWSYVWQGGAWRYPAYFDAFAQAEGIAYVLDSALRASGTVYSAGGEDLTRLGLRPEQALRLKIQDEGGASLLEVWIGRGIPGPGAQECYARLASGDTIFHLHANPRLALGRSAPPLLDTRVLPAALGRKPIARIEFAREGYALRSLRRLQTTPTLPTMPGRPPQMPEYQWLANTGGRDQVCGTANAFAYVDFLGQLRWVALRDPHLDFGPVQGRLRLADEDDSTDVIEVGGPDEQGRPLLRHQGTGLVCALAPDQAALLFPSQAALLDTLPAASPYRRAAPAAEGGF